MFDLPIRQLFKENPLFFFHRRWNVFQENELLSVTASHNTVLLPYGNIKCAKTTFDREDNNKNWVETVRFSRLSLCFPAPLAVNAKCASRTSRPQPLKRITAKMSKACFRRLLHLLPGRQKVKVHAWHTHTKTQQRSSKERPSQRYWLTPFSPSSPRARNAVLLLLHWDHPAASFRRLWLHWESAR